MDALREQMMKDLQLKDSTPRTQKKYLREVGVSIVQRSGCSKDKKRAGIIKPARAHTLRH